ncbi:MAG TPA: glycosyltransferase [Flavisolibacter sp.]|jgi:glycosyltransferase involved in cell wall biosynthesis|nr:glycosyltransferase [Flavisolibacter sp.]
MPKVLRILNRLAVGGPVLNATYLSKYLSPEFETLLVVGAKEHHEQSASFIADSLGVDVLTIPQMKRAVQPADDYQAFQAIRKVIKEFEPDVVHTHASKPGVLGRLAASHEGVPAIVHTFHGHSFHSYFNSLTSNVYIKAERFLARKSSAIVAISETQKRELVQDFRIAPEEKFRVIPLGLDLDKFGENMTEKRAKFRKEFAIAEDEIAIGIIGRLVPVKNHNLFLTAIAHVLKNTTKKIKAFIIGDGETRIDLENTAIELGIKFSTEKEKQHLHPLVFTSWRSDVDVINAGLDIVALTSLNEGTPVSLIEAQAANKPIVSTRVGGIGDIVIEGKTALLADVTDTALFCKHLLNLVANDALRSETGSKSRCYVTKRFSYHRLVTDMSELYYELLSEKITANAVLR